MNLFPIGSLIGGLSLGCISLLFACGGQPMGGNTGGAGGATSGVGPTSSSSKSSSSSKASSSSGAGGAVSAPTSACDSLPPCAASAQEAFTRPLSSLTSPNVVARAWVNKSAMGVPESIDVLICYLDYGEDLAQETYVKLASSPVAVGTETQISSTLSIFASQPTSQATPQDALSVVITKLGAPGEVVEGAFDIPMTNVAYGLSGKFIACRQADATLP